MDSRLTEEQTSITHQMHDAIVEAIEAIQKAQCLCATLCDSIEDGNGNANVMLGALVAAQGCFMSLDQFMEAHNDLARAKESANA